MKERTTRSLLRSVALVGAMAAGATAFGAKDQVWSGSASGSWDGANWADGTYDNGNYVVNDSSQDVTITFGSATTISTGLWIENGTDHTVTFAMTEGSDADAGLTARDFNIGTGTGAGKLTLASGEYKSLNDVVLSNGGNAVLTIDGATLTCEGVDAENDNAPIVKWFLLGRSDTAGTADTTVNLNGGTLAVYHIQRYTTGGTCQIVFNGGTLKALGDQQLVGDNWSDAKRYPTIVVGEKGGTIDTNGKTVTIDAPVTGTGTLNVIGGGKATFSFIPEDTVKITAAEGTTIDVAKDEPFTWTGAAEDGLWSNVNNWLVNGAVPTALPGDDSTVIFPAGDDVTVVVNGAHTGNMTINRNVTLAAENVSGSVYLYLDRVGGTGTLTLKGASNTRWLRVGNAGDYAIDCDLEIKGHVYLANSDAKTLVVNGAFKGDGTVTCNGNNDAGIAFYGDTSAFAGYYEGGLRNNGNRDNTKFRSDARGSALASWKFGGYGNTLASPFESDNVTYQFGALNTYVGTYPRLTLAGRTSTTIEVGAKGDSNVGGTLSNNGNTLRQVGDSTTLNLTLTENYGTVEAEAGTVVIYGTVAPAAAKFAGTGATIKIQRSSTTTTVVTPGVADDPETEENEYVEEVTETTTTTYIPASFVPGFTDALVGCQYEVTQETIDGVTYDVYTVLTDVATDSAGTTYDSVALAIAAIEADETDTLTKAITLAKSTAEAVALPLDYTLALNGNTVGSVVGVAGVAVSYNEETGTWTTVDNSKATWQGGTEGNWFDAANWSSGYVPDAGTAVTFTGNATVFLADNNTYDCGSIYISKDDATVTFAPVDYNESNWPRVKVYGNIGAHGDCVLKLYRCGIDNGTDGRITVRPTVTFENTTGDSWFTGNFDLQASLNGTGEFRIYGGTIHFTSGSGINVNAGSVVDFRNYYPTFYGSGGTLYSTGVNGDGRIIVHALPTSSTLVYFQNAFKNAERWSGTCELAGVTANNLNFSDYGNANSVVCINGVKGYLLPPANWGTVNVAEIKELNIAAGGLTLNGGAYSQKYYLFKSALTGSGPIAFGTSCGNVSYYVFTGDVSGFTGAINFGSLTTSNAPGVVFRTTSETSDLSAGHGTITVQEGVTLDVASTWTAPGGFKVMGTVNPSSLSVLSGSVLDVSTGTVVLPATDISTKTGLPLPALSSANGTLVIKGITRSDASKSLYLGTGAACTVKGTTQLDGDLYVTDGNSNVTYTWNKLTGSGAFFVTTAGGSASGITHAVTTLDNYTGTITAGGNVSLTIGTVAVDAVEVGVPVVKLAANSTLTTDPAAIALVVGGEATEAKLFKADDGNLYVAVAEVAVTTTPEEGDPVTTTTQFATYEAAAAFADANSVTEFTVLYGDGAVNGWDYDAETGKLTKNAAAIARVGAKQYDTLVAAFEAATAGDTVVLFGTSVDAAALSADGATLEIDTTATYTGTISGDGTVVANVAFTPVFGEWTGTFVVNWNLSGTSSKKAAVVLDNYGVAGSTVRVTQALENFYFKHKDKANSADVKPAVYFEADVTQNDGYTFGYNGGLATIFSQVGMAAGKTFATRGAGGTGNKYIFTKLDGFEGTLNVRSTDSVEINAVTVDATPAFGTKVVNATVPATASVTAQIAAGYPLVVKDDGLYFDPVAQVGEAYYNTLADAIAAANGATVKLVKSTDEAVVVADGQTVVIQFGDYSTGEITAADGCTLEQSWDEATKTGTYTASAQETEGVEPGETAEYDTEAEATAATMAVPEAVAAAVTGVALDQYKLYFKKVVTAPTTEGGKYTVEYVLNDTITGLIETEFAAKLATVDVGSLATAEEATAVTLTAAPGLYYGVMSQTSLGSGAPVTTESSVLATGETVTVTFPAADDSAQKFFTIFASPTDPAASSAGDDANVGNENGEGGAGA